MNKVIQNYVLKDKLGSGQYGNVFMAEDQKTKQIVAIKIMGIQKFKTTPKLSQLTSNEINILSKINSPHIIKFVEMLRTVNNYYLVYEYCNGGTLTQLLEKKKFLKQNQAMKIFAQMVEAFRVLTKQNILHRDLKPSNILFHDGVVKLADFGFCKELLKETDMAETMVGSPIYMAPEILKGQVYNSKADIWSMGVVLYEMLFGICPYEQKSIAKLMNLIDQHPLTFHLNINPISEGVQSLLRKMLTVDVMKRISPIDLINYKLLASYSGAIKRATEPTSRQNFKFHRQNLQYMLQVLLECASEVDSSKQRLVLTYLLYKLIFCYVSDLKKKARYWFVLKVTNFPDIWDKALQQQSTKLQVIGDTLRQAIQHTNPTTKIKIQLDTFYVNLSLFLEEVDRLRNSEPIKLQLCNCMLIYRHLFNVLEKNEVSFQPIVNSAEEGNTDQLIPRKMEKCREFAKQAAKMNL